MITGSIDCKTGAISVDKADGLYPLHLYSVQTTPGQPVCVSTEVLAPSPLVAAFLGFPFGYTHRTVVIEVLEENPEIGPYDHDQLENFVREHFVFGAPYYAKMKIEDVFAEIETCMAHAPVDSEPEKLPEPTPKAGPLAKLAAAWRAVAKWGNTKPEL